MQVDNSRHLGNKADIGNRNLEHDYMLLQNISEQIHHLQWIYLTDHY